MTMQIISLNNGDSWIDKMLSQTISNKALLEDIKRTEIELDAYKKIADGFLTLSNLPEANINPFQSREFFLDYEKYSAFMNDCYDLLNKLHKIRIDRGLK